MLGEGERIECEFSLSPRYLNFNLLTWSVIGFVVLFLGFIFLPLYFVGVAIFIAGFFHFGLYLRWANMFAFTNKRILIHRGWLSTSMMSIDYSQVTEVEARQGFIEKLMYHSGTLMINTAGSSDQEAVITNIPDPYTLKQQLTDLMEKDEQTFRTSSHN